mgnify:CR=1 FL=1
MDRLSETHLRYLLTIHHLGQTVPDVSVIQIARTLNVSKPSVTNMLNNLMDKGFLVKERYGKIYLTDTGFLLAKNFELRVEALCERLPSLNLDLSEDEQLNTAYLLAATLPTHIFEKLGIRTVQPIDADDAGET